MIVQFSDVEPGDQLSLAAGIFHVTGREGDGDTCNLIGEYITPDGDVLPQIFYGKTSSQAELI